MIKEQEFKTWLKINTNYSDAVIGDIISRIKRANKILIWNNTETYLFYLEINPQFKNLSKYVKSQLRKSVKLYSMFNSQINNFK